MIAPPNTSIYIYTTSLVDNNFFGTPMSLIPTFTPFLDNELKLRITKHAKKQVTIGTNLKSISVGGIQILNWTDATLETTLHRQLMSIESITEKKVIRHATDAKAKTFKDRLFYAIVPNQKNKTTTFYFQMQTPTRPEALPVAYLCLSETTLSYNLRTFVDQMKWLDAWTASGILKLVIIYQAKKRTEKINLLT